MSSAQLTPTSYLVLGLLAREGPSTPYDLKRRVRATLGHVWSFPHTQLYTEPGRLADLGFATEQRERHGRRRRIFTINDKGRAALRDWLDAPSSEPTELRDQGLLQLFFADLAESDGRRRIALRQLALHQAKLAQYEDDARRERRDAVGQPSSGVDRTSEQWRGETLRMALLYERAAVEFWTEAAGKSAD
jgi:PadR family transcriptional regulator AphA